MFTLSPEVDGVPLPVNQKGAFDPSFFGDWSVRMSIWFPVIV
jgi:hypothetical protein